jgi:hypothetical protein
MQFDCLRALDVFAANCKRNPSLRLRCLRFSISQLAKKGRFVPPFPPSFGQIRTDRSRSSANLIRKRIPLFRRERLRQLEYRHRGLKRQRMRLPLRVRDNLHFHTHAPFLSNVPYLSPVSRVSSPVSTSPATALAACRADMRPNPSPPAPKACPKSRPASSRLSTRCALRSHPSESPASRSRFAP